MADWAKTKISRVRVTGLGGLKALSAGRRIKAEDAGLGDRAPSAGLKVCKTGQKSKFLNCG